MQSKLLKSVIWEHSASGVIDDVGGTHIASMSSGVYMDAVVTTSSAAG